MYTYKGSRKSRFNREGRIKGQVYDHIFQKSNKNDILKRISARSPEEAEQKYKRLIFSEYGQGGVYAPDSLIEVSSKVQGLYNLSVTSSIGSGIKPSQMMMRKYEPLKYNFIQSDDKFLSNPGFCVPDQFVNTYSKYIKKLTLDYFIDLCYKVRGEDRTVEIKKSLLDYDLKDDDEDNKDKKWDISQGVSPEMLKKICKELNISMYAFDITKQCFLKTISNDRNYPAFVFYAVSNHCYHITNSNVVKSLVEQAKDIEHKIKSNCVIEEIIEKDTINKFNTMEIKIDVPIDELNDYKDCFIIYTKNDLNDELDKIIGQYNYIPKIQNHQQAIIYIHFNLNDLNIHLYSDPNVNQFVIIHISSQNVKN